MGQKSIYDLISDLSEKIRGLEAERDALRKDAERYRWLRDQWGYLCVGEGVIELEGKFNPMDGFLDEAIDAAIAAKEPKMAHKIEKWGYCWTCGHDAIPGESCARDNCPNAAAKGAQS